MKIDLAEQNKCLPLQPAGKNQLTLWMTMDCEREKGEKIKIKTAIKFVVNKSQRIFAVR